MRPEVIYGPPGTGKTTTLIGIVEEELARGTPPDRIGYVTFTRRAAEEAVDRACRKFSLARGALPHFRTLHSLCFRLLGMRSADVLEGDRLQDFADYAGVRITGRYSEDGTMTGFAGGDRILFMENLARTMLVELRQVFDWSDDDQDWDEVDRVSRSLRQYKTDNGLVDYTDMLLDFRRSGVKLKLDVLIGDEAQDMSALQWRVFGILAQGCRRVVVAGDDDQAVFKWAGADPDHLVSLDGAQRILGRSYRVPPAIQRVSAEIISTVSHRREKAWEPRAGAGEVVRVNEFMDVDVDEEWASDVQPVLVLARNSYILREQVEPELRRRGVVFERWGRPSIREELLAVVHDWEALRAGKAVSVQQVRRVYDYMSPNRGYRRGHKELTHNQTGWEPDDLVTLLDLKNRGGLICGTNDIWHEALDRLPRDEVEYIIAARRRGERLRGRPRVRLSTIHGAKGGEADHVVLMKEMARRTHREMERAPDDEARVWYVGVTRAREKLTIVESETAQECPWL